MNEGPREFDRVRVLREVLTATGAGLYLANHVAGPIPAETMTAVHESDDLELRIGRVGPDRADDLGQREKEARAVVAATIKAAPERVVLTHGIPEIASDLAADLLREGDGSGVVVVEGVSDALVDAVGRAAEMFGSDLSRSDRRLRILPADVALVVAPHIDTDGNLVDISALHEAAAAAGARLLVDASLSVGARSIDVATFGADAVIAETHRWLLGPEAVAMVWLSPELGEDLPDRLRTGIGPFSRGVLLALARSVGWLLMYAELPWAVSRTDELANRLHDALAAIDGLDVVGGAEDRSAIATLRISDWDALGAAEELGRSSFAIVEADADQDVLRASVGAWNREQEIDRFVERVSELAAHTPATLPRKPSLTVLDGVSEDGADE